MAHTYISHLVTPDELLTARAEVLDGIAVVIFDDVKIQMYTGDRQHSGAAELADTLLRLSGQLRAAELRPADPTHAGLERIDEAAMEREAVGF